MSMLAWHLIPQPLTHHPSPLLLATCRQVRLVNIKLISLTELKLITDRGAEGRRKLSELLAGDGRLVSSINREAVI